MEFEIIPLLLSLLPAILLVVLAAYFFKLHTDNEQKRRKFLLHREHQKQTLPLRLQAYERLALLLERISLDKLLIRTAPVDDNKKVYESLLIKTIDQEFEHNLTQQIYISDEAWGAIKVAKNTTISIIRKAAQNESTATANEMRQSILTDLLEKASPSDTALTFIKSEIWEIF